MDRRSGAAAWNLEASRRVRSRWRVGLEARAFRATAPDDPLSGFRRDGYVQTELAYRF